MFGSLNNTHGGNVGLLEELVALHRKDLKRRGISFNEKHIQRYHAIMKNCSADRLRIEIADKLNPFTEADKAVFKAAKQERKVQAEKRQHDWEQKLKDAKAKFNKDAKAKFNKDDYDAFKRIKVGGELTGELGEKIIAVEDNGDLVLEVNPGEFWHKHMLPNKQYTFGIHIFDKGEMNIWSLKPEEHESYEKGRGYGADVIIMYDDGDFYFDLDD